ncbi:MAG: bifunctional DNA-formamidopyrimidine glycosylase/DNA-(apurinic or apyrimidinic site) lyase [Alphaproteobacteria bacterium]|nr:bifunctional DNA-formamidopyrimidine glycosylase/DNA-(apurinic or apyrimidinic site) lyase [Alphaproteobacteria bacterium]
MPELPEVETVRRGLMPALEGATFARVIARRPDLRWPLPEGFVQHLTGAKVLKLTRRGKFILAHLDREKVLLMHLGMSGRMTVTGPNGRAKTPGEFYHEVASKPDGPHDHIVFETDGGARIVFTDHRRFGMMDLIDACAVGEHRLLRDLGPEPLEPSYGPEALHAALAGRRTPIKAALLDQKTVAGLGNIYVCESLFRAGISPRRLAASVGYERVKRLHGAIQAVLLEAIEAGGSTLRDYAHADGELGYFQHRFAVYDRLGEPCRRKGCSGTVARLVQSARSTFYCGRCQR